MYRSIGRIDNFILLNHIGYNLSNFSLVSTIGKCFHIDRSLAFNSNLIFSKNLCKFMHKEIISGI